MNDRTFFFSHGHIDHVNGIVGHAARRELYSRKPATYHVADHLVDPLTLVASGFCGLHGPDQTFSNLSIKSFNVGETFQVCITNSDEVKIT